MRRAGDIRKNEEIFKLGEKQYHFIVTVKPFSEGEDIGGAVVSFRDIEEAQKLVYNFNTRAMKNTVDDIIGTSDRIMLAKKQALITARGNSTVLITERAARERKCSPRRYIMPAPG